MIAVSPTMTKTIDETAELQLGIPTVELMRRAGLAVAQAAAPHTVGGAALILAGCGNNGGDGYAAACALMRSGFRAVVIDVTGRGQRTPAGQHFMREYLRMDAERIRRATEPLDAAVAERKITLEERAARIAALKNPETMTEASTFCHTCLIDAILGTGATLPVSEALHPAAELLAKSTAYKIAVDLPLGVDAEGGTVDPCAYTADETVVLGFPKHGLYSYPACTRVGRLTTCGIGLDTPALRALLPLPEGATDLSDIPAMIPARDPAGHKGSFGHLLMLCGSPRYRGAAMLSAEAALRMGAGLVTLASDDAVTAPAVTRMPELITERFAVGDALAPLTARKTAILVGPGCPPEGLMPLLTELILTEGAPLILDAGALGALAEAGDAGLALLRSPARPVVLTPHPAEMARILRITVEEVQAARLPIARRFAAEHRVTLVLKGARTVVAEGDRFAVNLTGGPALAKGGSGDVLAGAIASLIATGVTPYEAARLAVCLHGAAGDRLAERYSALGVRPSDLPAEMAALLAEATT